MPIATGTLLGEKRVQVAIPAQTPIMDPAHFLSLKQLLSVTSCSQSRATSDS